MTEHIILALGTTNNAKETAIKQMQVLLRVAKEKFPSAQICVPKVNFSTMLPTKEQTQLAVLNAPITQNLKHIPAWPSSKFRTEGDLVHWTADTPGIITQHWLQHFK